MGGGRPKGPSCEELGDKLTSDNIFSDEIYVVFFQACMLTFYPEFEVDAISENEIIFLLDLSNSMKVRTSHSFA